MVNGPQALWDIAISSLSGGDFHWGDGSSGRIVQIQMVFLHLRAGTSLRRWTWIGKSHTGYVASV